MPFVAGLIIAAEILFFVACAVIIVYLIFKRAGKPNDFENRDN